METKTLKKPNTRPYNEQSQAGTQEKGQIARSTGRGPATTTAPHDNF